MWHPQVQLPVTHHPVRPGSFPNRADSAFPVGAVPVDWGRVYPRVEVLHPLILLLIGCPLQLKTPGKHSTGNTPFFQCPPSAEPLGEAWCGASDCAWLPSFPTPPDPIVNCYATATPTNFQRPLCLGPVGEVVGAPHYPHRWPRLAQGNAHRHGEVGWHIEGFCTGLGESPKRTLFDLPICAMEGSCAEEGPLI